MKFTICHDTSKKTLAIPRAALQLSGLEDAERLTLHVGHGCTVLTRQEPTARERLETIRLLHNLNIGTLVCLALDSRAAKTGPHKRVPRALRSYDADFLDMLDTAAWICMGWAPAGPGGGRPMSLTYYSMDDLRLGRGGFLRKAGPSGSSRSWRRPWSTTGASPSPNGRYWA